MSCRFAKRPYRGPCARLVSLSAPRGGRRASRRAAVAARPARPRRHCQGVGFGEQEIPESGDRAPNCVKGFPYVSKETTGRPALRLPVSPARGGPLRRAKVWLEGQKFVPFSVMAWIPPSPLRILTGRVSHVAG